jgi:hypothetical protein
MRNTQKEKGDILLLFLLFIQECYPGFSFLKSISGTPATIGTTSNSRDNQQLQRHQQQQEQPATDGKKETVGTLAIAGTTAIGMESTQKHVTNYVNVDSNSRG